MYGDFVLHQKKKKKAGRIAKRVNVGSNKPKKKGKAKETMNLEIRNHFQKLEVTSESDHGSEKERMRKQELIEGTDEEDSTSSSQE